MVLVGPAPALVSAAESTEAARQKFTAEFGSPEPHPEANAALAKCKLPLPSLPREEWPPMFRGTLYSTGYYRAGTDPGSVRHDWVALAKALKQARALASILENQYESSAQDVSYFPLVIAPELGKEEEWAEEDLLDLLGLSDRFAEAAEEASWQEDDMIGAENAFVEESEFDEDEIEEYYSQETLEAYRAATRWMRENLEEPTRVWLDQWGETQRFSVHPILWVGRTAEGVYVGVFTVRVDL
jgi:hypothetical protein